jgi:hypothetical protein
MGPMSFTLIVLVFTLLSLIAVSLIARSSRMRIAARRANRERVEAEAFDRMLEMVRSSCDSGDYRRGAAAADAYVELSRGGALARKADAQLE